MIPMLDNIKIESDGTVVSASRNIIIAISPVAPEAKKNLPIEESPQCSATIPSELANKVIQAIGNDTSFGGRLEYADISKENGKVLFTVKDEHNKTVRIEGDEARGTWVPWRDYTSGYESVTGTFILHRQRLQMLLSILDKVIPAKGSETPVYLEFTKDNNVIVRGKNYITGQYVYGIMMSYKGEWLAQSEWEDGIRSKAKPANRTKRI
jgi:hypothetical protein